jgi:CheY-like chemotaxis protein
MMGTDTGRILIVDDDSALRKLMAGYLSRLGYQTVSCGTAEEALSLVENEPAMYSLALVDLNMPGMRGEELTRRIRQCNAPIHLIVASGFGGRVEGVSEQTTFLQKPFTPNELAQAVRDALES